ncbi:MAG: hypothetical protein IMX02_13630 [Limnochordaceae bacterium]|nr:hypothetical protein [Limnochordaceae bacterium]
MAWISRDRAHRVALVGVTVAAWLGLGGMSGSGCRAAGFIQPGPVDGWRVRLSIERAASPGGTWPEWRDEPMSVGLEGSRRWVWSAAGVEWRSIAGASWRAVHRSGQSDLEWPLGPDAGPSGSWGVLFEGASLALTASARDEAGASSREWSVALGVQAPGDGGPWYPVQTIGMTQAWVMDPALVAVGGAMSAGGGSAPLARWTLHGQWIHVLSDRLGLHASVEAGWSLPGRELAARVASGLTLFRDSRKDVSVTVSWRLDDPGAYALWAELQWPSDGA